MEFLITGATGEVGSRVVERLLERGERPRVLVRDVEKAQRRYGDRVDIVAGDLNDAVSLAPALEGVDALFLVNSGPQIPVRDETAAKASKAAGVKLLVKLSSLDVQQGLAIGAWHELGEEAVRASGVAFTFVQPTGFMSNLLAWAPPIRAEGVVRSSTGEGRRPFIHPDDIAAVAVEALTTGRFEGESLPITGPESLNFAEITERIGAAIRRELRYEVICDEEARRRYAATGAAPEETEAHVALWRAIREGRLAQTTDVVERTLGRGPLRLDRWIVENQADFAA